MKNPNQQVFWACAMSLFLFSACKKDISIDSGVDTVIETQPAVAHNVSVDVGSNCGGYYEALPSRYDSSHKKYPLILFIHGIGELGNGRSDLGKMTVAGLPALIHKKKFPASFESDGQHYAFIVIAPQFKARPSNEQVKDVLSYAVRKYRVDTSRIYVTGLSMGGGVTWEFSSAFGSSVAAAVPICGGSWPDPKRAEKIAGFNVPVWAFHNDDDPTVPVSYTRDYVSRINSFHPLVAAKLTTWAKGGHNSWTKAYDPAYKENGKNIYEWMLQYKRLLK